MGKLFLTLQVAYAHLFFNLTGIVIWYGIWPMRRIPIKAAKVLGDTTAKYRWFALAYLAVCFFIVPAIIMGISLASDAALIVTITICVLIALFVVIVNVMQTRNAPTFAAEVAKLAVVAGATSLARAV